MSKLYKDLSLYTTQLRALESTVKQKPDDAGPRFLLAYHYMVGGHPDAAQKQLTQVAKLVPNDRVATDLVRLISGVQTASANAQTTGQQSNAIQQPNAPQQATAGVRQPVPQPPATGDASPNQPPAPTGPPIDATALVGKWEATRDDGSTFGLTLNKDNTFTWKFAAKDQKPQSFDGKYSVEGNVLALEREGGGSMIAEVAKKDDDKFNFRPVGAPQEDHGLTFKR
jgi:uncharacterized protein (TIGR03066 family)